MVNSPDREISIFISYSHENLVIAQKVRNWLQAASFDVWSDEDLSIGSVDWQLLVQRAIDEADYMLVLFSPEARNSYWVMEELSYAAKQKTNVVPLLVSGDLTYSVPLNLLEMNVIDLRHNFESAMAALTARILRGIKSSIKGEEDKPETTPKQTQWLHEIFLSYSRTDVELMHKIKSELISSNLRVWSDEELRFGSSSWLTAVQSAIEKAGCLVGILSPDAKASEWVVEELNFARIHERRRFLLLARGNEKNAIPFGVAQIQYADLRSDYEAGIRKTIADIKTFLETD